MNKKKVMISLAMALVSLAGFAADNLPALRVDGKNLVDENGKTVVLHGVMDTPNRYFNGNRWGTGGYNVSDVTPCLNYFEKIFTAITDKEHGAYCDVFRLHMDPAWTNDPTKPKPSGENDISAFSEYRYRIFLSKLYIKLIEKALAHGLYVVVRPPGVCPQELKVGDAYQAYLQNVWKVFASDATIQKYAGQVSIELANEPVHVSLANGSASDKALHDYFQPVVDVIREAGFKGIVWVPGTGWQSQYQSYAKYPVTDNLNNLGYAVHCYPGWYNSGSNDNDNTDKVKMYDKFIEQVPVVKSNPIIVTEIDWSPGKPGTGHYDEHNNWVVSNYGTWGTAKTSGFGEGFKYIHDQLGNVSMTLQGTGTYLDIDAYLKDQTVQPAFQEAKEKNLLDECCSAACFKWYKEWYVKQNPTGIKQTESTADVVSTLYYNVQGQQVDRPTAGVYIVKQVLSNGKIQSRKVCSTK